MQILSHSGSSTGETRGVVWLAQEPGLGSGVAGAFFGYWETDVGGQVIEEVEGIGTADEAIVWGRLRAPCVLIRLVDTGYFSAGTHEPHWNLSVPRWPG